MEVESVIGDDDDGSMMYVSIPTDIIRMLMYLLDPTSVYTLRIVSKFHVELVSMLIKQVYPKGLEVHAIVKCANCGAIIEDDHHQLETLPTNPYGYSTYEILECTLGCPSMGRLVQHNYARLVDFLPEVIGYYGVAPSEYFQKSQEILRSNPFDHPACLGIAVEYKCKTIRFDVENRYITLICCSVVGPESAGDIVPPQPAHFCVLLVSARRWGADGNRIIGDNRIVLSKHSDRPGALVFGEDKIRNMVVSWSQHVDDYQSRQQQ